NILIDSSCKDIPRACFLCHDADAYFDENVAIINVSFIDKFNPKQEKEVIKAREPFTDYNFVIASLKRWLHKKESFKEGNRNNYITQLVAVCNRFGVPKQIIEGDLITY